VRLLDEIRANLDDDGPRLVYADELMSRGDPRGEFIAVQCELARLGFARRAPHWDWIGDALVDVETIDLDRVRMLRARETALLGENGEAWRDHNPRVFLYSTWRFERGFIAAIETSAEPERLAVLLDHLPMVVDIALGTPHGPLAFPALAQLRAFQLGPLAPLRAAATPALRRLVLTENVLDARELLALPALHQLHAFHARVRFDAGDLARLIDEVPALEDLALANSQLGSEHARALNGAPLRVLSLLGNRLGPDGTRALAEAASLVGMRALDLRRNAIGVAGAAALGGAFPELRTLDLTANSLGADGVRALASGGGLGKLRELCLQHTQLDDAAVAVLAASPLLAHVTTLSLRSNKITDAGARALARCTNLQQINLNKNQVGKRAKQELAAATGARVLA